MCEINKIVKKKHLQMSHSSYKQVPPPKKKKKKLHKQISFPSMKAIAILQTDLNDI